MHCTTGLWWFYLPCVSWFRQSHSTQSTGIWPADSASSCPLWNRSHGSTLPDSWQKTHSSSSVFQRWNKLNWSHEENYPPIVPFCQAMQRATTGSKMRTLHMRRAFLNNLAAWKCHPWRELSTRACGKTEHTLILYFPSRLF